MQHEYATLNADKTRAAASAGQAEIENVLKRLAGPLSNLAALDALAAAGKAVEAADVLALARGVEKELARVGLERVGVVGESLPFDAALHQRMSGGEVHGGTPVVVRIPGYRLGRTVLLKAMVSTKEAPGG
jgi:molecular chaperone GrpE (heat shock protein)